LAVTGRVNAVEYRSGNTANAMAFLCGTLCKKGDVRKMEIPELIVASICLLAVIAHVIGGSKETAAIKPASDDSKLNAHWVQAMCAFQMLAVDLLAVCLLLFAIAFYDLGPQEDIYVLLLSALFFCWGLVWVIQLIWIKRTPRYLFRLPHWLVWFFCSAVLYWS